MARSNVTSIKKHVKKREKGIVPPNREQQALDHLIGLALLDAEGRDQFLHYLKVRHTHDSQQPFAQASY